MIPRSRKRLPSVSAKRQGGIEGDYSEGGVAPLTNQLRDEKTESNPDRRDEIPRVFLRREHKDGEDELRSEDHFDDHALRNGRASP